MQRTALRTTIDPRRYAINEVMSKDIENQILIKEVSPGEKEVVSLFRLLDAHNRSHCPPEICHLTQPEELQEYDHVLVGAFSDNRLCGMGGLKFFADYAEVTRMYVREEYQGRKIGCAILKTLESIAKARGADALKLETSVKFEKAVNLYTKYGFKYCEPFGEYVHKAHNTYMEKPIDLCT